MSQRKKHNTQNPSPPERGQGAVLEMRKSREEMRAVNLAAAQSQKTFWQRAQDEATKPGAGELSLRRRYDAISPKSKSPTSPQNLLHVWNKLKKDREGGKALSSLRDAGFHLIHRKPDLFTCIPFLSHRDTHGHRITKPKQAIRLVMRYLRELSGALRSQFPSLESYDPELDRIYSQPGIKYGYPNFDLVANMLEEIASRFWFVTEYNEQNRAITVLLEEIKEDTGEYHYEEVLDLLEALFRCAGMSGGFRFTHTSLEKFVKHNKASKSTAHRKLKNGTTPKRLGVK